MIAVHHGRIGGIGRRPGVGASAARIGIDRRIGIGQRIPPQRSRHEIGQPLQEEFDAGIGHRVGDVAAVGIPQYRGQLPVGRQDREARVVLVIDHIDTPQRRGDIRLGRKGARGGIRRGNSSARVAAALVPDAATDAAKGSSNEPSIKSVTGTTSRIILRAERVERPSEKSSGSSSASSCRRSIDITGLRDAPAGSEFPSPGEMPGSRVQAAANSSSPTNHKALLISDRFGD